jgi:hypothetical protein
LASRSSPVVWSTAFIDNRVLPRSSKPSSLTLTSGPLRTEPSAKLNRPGYLWLKETSIVKVDLGRATLMPVIYQIFKTEKIPSLTVVFIHGSGGDHLTTWMPLYQKDCLLHWLAEDLKDSDILSVGHEADAKSMSDYATLAEYASVISYGLKPLVRGKSVLFVCHSLGGLIAKQIVSMSSANQIQSDGFANSLIDFCFIGTPHSGVHFRWLRKVHAVIFRNKLGGLLLGDSPTLRNLNREFLKVISGRIVCFVERRRWRFFRLMPDNSGMIDDPRVINLAISKKHEDLCKPQSRNDVVYQAILRLGLSRLSRRGIISDSNYINNSVVNEAIESLRGLDSEGKQSLDEDVISQALRGLGDPLN